MPSAYVSGTPIAVRTWLGSILPLAQAEPADAAIPSASSRMSSDSASTPAKPRFALFASRAVGWPFSRTSGISAMHALDQAVAQRGAVRDRLAAASASARASAVAIPTA